MTSELTVVINDEADPVLAIVTGPHNSIPLVYRDYRGMYDRPAHPLSQRDFAEWVVIEFFESSRVVSSRHAALGDEDHAWEEEFLSVIQIVVEDAGSKSRQGSGVDCDWSDVPMESRPAWARVGCTGVANDDGMCPAHDEAFPNSH